MKIQSPQIPNWGGSFYNSTPKTLAQFFQVAFFLFGFSVFVLASDYPYSWAPGKLREGCTATEVCAKGYTTKSIRPPVSYTNTLKKKQMREHNLAGTMKDYEEDHVVPLEACGDPRDPMNLSPQPYSPVPGAHQKDWVETWWHEQLCDGKMTPQDVLKDIPNWKQRYEQINSGNE